MIRGYRLYTDGSSHARGGLPGGWAWILVRLVGDGVVEPMQAVPHRAGSGGHPATSNNRMELSAILEGIKYVQRTLDGNIDVEICSDSQYALNMAEGNWNASSNADIILELKTAVAVCRNAGIRLKFSWVRGHNGEPWNEMVDKLATNAKAKVIASLTKPPHS